jgi:hypothetical protein
MLLKVHQQVLSAGFRLHTQQQHFLTQQLVANWGERTDVIEHVPLVEHQCCYLLVSYKVGGIIFHSHLVKGPVLKLYKIILYIVMF